MERRLDIVDNISNLQEFDNKISLDINRILDNQYKIEKVTVTCIVLTYNEERCIKRCLDHVIEAFDEVVIVDTGSTDNTLSIISSMLSDKVKLFNYKWCDSFADVRNFGIDQATSSWVAFIDADEVIEIEEVEKLYDILSLFDEVIQRDQLTLSFEIHEKDINAIYDDIPRIIYREGNCRYFGRVHEEIRLDDEWILVKTNIKLLHDGYNLQIMDKKSKKNKEFIIVKKMYD